MAERDDHGKRNDDQAEVNRQWLIAKRAQEAADAEAKKQAQEKPVSK